ncbi:hypothetical protein [Burkholderia sp. TSV86]|uniref:hypothetical protein n=1 Tax=Burkholderia sp. TSV86 TaxID=1385594 RepID=UPI00075E3470|nr:hypothetical protein [Burkholderia sp. TSV86]KVE32515.1 hypothetical protein WS68_15305 [Burkholderia sp. TSV86]
MTFVKNAGYNPWAEANNTIVLYPQLYGGAENTEAPSNLLGCRDWWEYNSMKYATHAGNQMKAVKAIVDRISGGAK